MASSKDDSIASELNRMGITKKELEEIHDIFKLYDRDGDGGTFSREREREVRDLRVARF